MVIGDVSSGIKRTESPYEILQTRPKVAFGAIDRNTCAQDFGFAMHLASDGLLIRLSFQRVASGDVGCRGVWFMETVLFTSPYEHLMCMVGELLVETEFYSCVNGFSIHCDNIYFVLDCIGGLMLERTW